MHKKIGHLTKNYKKGANHVTRHNFTRYFSFAAFGNNPSLAAQQVVGVWSQRRYWTGLDHCCDSARIGQTVNNCTWGHGIT